MSAQSKTWRKFRSAAAAFTGAVAFLRKPFNDELFIKTLRVALN